jgi:hypothetical protein
MSDDTPDEVPRTRIIRPDFGPREAVSYTKARTPQTKYAGGGGGSIYQELGRTGLRHWGGFVFEEWLRELQQGRRAAEVYREMMDSDPVIGGMMYAIEMLCRRVNWWMEPASSSQLDQRNAAWADTILHDQSYAWTDQVAEILSFLGYGWAYFEEVFKVRRTRPPTTSCGTSRSRSRCCSARRSPKITQREDRYSDPRIGAGTCSRTSRTSKGSASNATWLACRS